MARQGPGQGRDAERAAAGDDLVWVHLGLAGQGAHQLREVVLVDGAVVVLDALAEAAAAGVVGQDDEARAREQLRGVGVHKGQARLKAGRDEQEAGPAAVAGGAEELGGQSDAVGQGDPELLAARTPGGVVEARRRGDTAGLWPNP